MPDTQSGLLIDCFEKVFPTLAHVTLLSLIGEAFSIDIDFEQFEEATSFAAILDLIRRHAATNA